MSNTQTGLILQSMMGVRYNEPRYTYAVLADSPVAYWKMDETSGTVLYDSSGNDLHGTYVNSPTLGHTPVVPGYRGSVYMNSANSEHAIVSYDPLLQPTAGFTLELWMDMENRSTINMPCGNLEFGGFGFIYAESTASFEIWIRLSETDYTRFQIPAESMPPIGTVFHLVGTYDGDVVRVFIGDVDSDMSVVFEYNVTPTTIDYDYTNGFGIGTDVGTGDVSQDRYFFDGSIGHVAVYDYALTYEQIQSHHLAARNARELTLATDIEGGTNYETYSNTLAVSGDSGGVTWYVVDGSLPAGLHLNYSTGEISGVPEDTVGHYTATVFGVDTTGRAVTEQISIGIADMISLIHFEGADNQTTFTDETGRTWGRVSSPYIDTAQSKFGGSSARIPSSGDRIICTVADQNGDFDFGDDDFCFDLWARAYSYSGPNYPGLFGKRSGNTNTTCGISCGYNGNSGSYPVTARINWDTSYISGVWYTPVGEWFHVAFNRIDGVLKMFVNGVEEGSVAAVTMTGGSTSDMMIGAHYDHTSTGWWNGWIDEWRVSRGAGKWRKSFTPPSAPSDYPQPAPSLSVKGALPAGSVGVAYSSLTDISIPHGTATGVSVVVGALPAGWAATVNGGYVEVTGPGVPAGVHRVVLEVTDGSNTAQLPLVVVVA